MFHLMKIIIAILFIAFASGSQKTRIKELFDEMADEEFNVHPQLIRMAFHDAAHFDQNDGQYRLGCFMHLVGKDFNECRDHSNMDDAIILREEIFQRLIADGFNPSHADLTQLLGALAVDRLSKETNPEEILYDRIRLGRIDLTEEDCLEVCERLPAFSAGGASSHARFRNVFTDELVGKMVENMGFSEREAISLLGAHTVGRVRDQFPCDRCNGPWTMNPFVFDNAYFQDLQAVVDRDGDCTAQKCATAPFGRKFPSWFQDTSSRNLDWNDEIRNAGGDAPNAAENLKPLMLDIDMSLARMRPDIVKEFADDMRSWQTEFNNAYVKMSELGCEGGVEEVGFELTPDKDADTPQEPTTEAPQFTSIKLVEGVYTIQQKKNGRFLDAKQKESLDFRASTQKEQGNDSQKWRLTCLPAMPGVCRLQHLSNDRFLDAYITEEDDHRAVTRTLETDGTQLWKFTEVSTKVYRLQQLLTDRFLDASRSSSKKFRAFTRDFQDNDSQLWIFTHQEGMHYATCGRSGHCEEGTTLVDNSEPRSVRCVSDLFVADWVHKETAPETCPTQWQSIWWKSPEPCQSASFSDAVGFCASLGTRLPTLEEAESGCIAKGSCEHDSTQIWTSDS